MADGVEKLKAEIEALTGKLQALLAQRDGIDRQIEPLKIRLETYRHAYAIVSGSDQPPTSNGRFKPTDKAKAWSDSLKAMRAQGLEFTTDDIFADVNRRVEMTRSIVRGRLADLVEKGLLHRKSEGVFEFNEE